MDIRTAAISDKQGVLVGDAIVYGSPSCDLGGFVEIIEHGAFRAHLSTKPDIRALYEHDGSELLGRTTSGTLKVIEHDKGVSVEIDPPDTRAGNDAKTLVTRGDINGMSFGFVATRDRWDWDTTPPTRYVKQAELREVTITATPAYQASNITLRSLKQFKNEGTDLNALWLEYLEV
jgi:HK97 family phage prohead protease